MLYIIINSNKIIYINIMYIKILIYKRVRTGQIKSGAQGKSDTRPAPLWVMERGDSNSSGPRRARSSQIKWSSLIKIAK